MAGTPKAAGWVPGVAATGETLTYERLRGTCGRLPMLMHHTRHMIVGHFDTMNCNGAGVDISPSCNVNVNKLLHSDSSSLDFFCIYMEKYME